MAKHACRESSFFKELKKQDKQSDDVEREIRRQNSSDEDEDIITQYTSLQSRMCLVLWWVTTEICWFFSAVRIAVLGYEKVRK